MCGRQAEQVSIAFDEPGPESIMMTYVKKIITQYIKAGVCTLRTVLGGKHWLCVNEGGAIVLDTTNSWIMMDGNG